MNTSNDSISSNHTTNTETGRFKTIRKWLFGLAVVLLTVAALLLYLVDQDMKQLYGAHTKVVDHTQFKPVDKMTAITNVSVLSPNGQQMLAGRTVLIDNGKVISVTQGIDVPQKAHIVDGSGKFLIPGLVDSHTHVLMSPNDLLLYVANGVTHIRDMAGSKARLALRDEIENGRLGPRLYVTSPQMSNDSFFVGLYKDFTRFSVNVHNPERAVEKVRSYAEQGYDAIKVYHLNMATHRAINKIAEEIGIPTVGHLPMGMDASELRTTQQQEIAHIEELVKLLQREFWATDKKGPEAFRQFVKSRSDAISDDLLENDITVHTVLWFMESIGKQALNLDALLSEAHIEYANPGIVEGYEYAGLGWLPERNRFLMSSDTSTEELDSAKEFYKAWDYAHHILLNTMIQKGVKIIAGTDANTDIVVPGFSMHDELKSLNRAGLSPTQTLLSATAIPAELMNSNAGEISPGRRADLVLLDKNPLVDIENTKAIEAVVLNGRFLDREQLDVMLDAVKDANDQSRKVSIDQYR